MKEDKKNKVIVLLSIVVIILSFLCIYFTFIYKSNSKTSNEPKEEIAMNR